MATTDNIPPTPPRAREGAKRKLVFDDNNNDDDDDSDNVSVATAAATIAEMHQQKKTKVATDNTDEPALSLTDLADKWDDCRKVAEDHHVELYELFPNETEEDDETTALLTVFEPFQTLIKTAVAAGMTFTVAQQGRDLVVSVCLGTGEVLKHLLKHLEFVGPEQKVWAQITLKIALDALVRHDNFLGCDVEPIDDMDILAFNYTQQQYITDLLEDFEEHLIVDGSTRGTICANDLEATLAETDLSDDILSAAKGSGVSTWFNAIRYAKAKFMIICHVQGPRFIHPFAYKLDISRHPNTNRAAIEEDFPVFVKQLVQDIRMIVNSNNIAIAANNSSSANNNNDLVVEDSEKAEEEEEDEIEDE